MNEILTIGMTVGAIITRGANLPPDVERGANQLAALGYYEYAYSGRDNRGNVVWKLMLGDGTTLLLVTRRSGYISKG